MACGNSKISRVLAWKPFVAVGLISYPLYLWHWPVLALLRYVYMDNVLPVSVGGRGIGFVDIVPLGGKPDTAQQETVGQGIRGRDGGVFCAGIGGECRAADV